MNRYLIVLLLFIFFLVPQAKADYITTETFVVDATNTVSIAVSGTLYTTIEASHGNLGTALNIDFNIISNEDLNTVTLKTFVKDSTSVKHSAFYCTGSTPVTSQSMFLVLANSGANPPIAGSIADCKQNTSTATSNANAIAYPGVVTITGPAGSSITYVPNGSDGYFSTVLKAGTTDLIMSVSTVAKAGTVSSLDTADSYQVEIYLDNIP